MKFLKIVVLILVAAVLILVLVRACGGEQRGPAEQVGKNIDDAVGDLTNSGGEMEKAGEDAGRSVGKALDNAGEAINNN